MKTQSILKPALRAAVWCLLIGLLLPVLVGCSATVTPTAELWIVTEQTTWDRMNGQLYAVKEAFEADHPGISIRVDMLPTDQQERSVYLQQLRTLIMQGGGPDGYLLPTDNTLILDEPEQYTYIEAEPLFVDVALAMANGLFCDISGLYDADDSLGKDGLNAAVMEAGTLDGARYVLPLRFDIPVIYAEAEALEAAGLDATLLDGDILTVMEAVLATGDPVLAGGILHSSLDAFSEFLDYSTGNALLDADTLIRYMQVYQQLRSLLGDQYVIGEEHATEETTVLEGLDLVSYIMDKYGDPEPPEPLPDNVFIPGGFPVEEQEPYRTEYCPLYVGSLSDVLAYVPLTQYKGTGLIMEPMRAVGGEVVATVTYYAAVGSGCADPELTYDFLRRFLLEDSQWEQNRPVRKHTISSNNSSNDLQYPGLIESGWPVRAENTVQLLWQIRRKQIFVRNLGFGVTSTARERMRKIGLMGTLPEEQMPFLDTAIDEVRFNTTTSEEFAAILASLNDSNTPTDTHIPTAAQQLIWALRWHISEG